MLLILVPMVVLNFFRSLRAIAILSAIGNILMLLSLVFIFQVGHHSGVMDYGAAYFSILFAPHMLPTHSRGSPTSTAL